MNHSDDIVPLSSLKKGERVSITGFATNHPDRLNRLYELGFVQGSEITACGKAPFGDPLMFTIHGGKLALRKTDAKQVLGRIV